MNAPTPKRLTKAQWALLQEELSSIFGTAVMVCDGHRITLVVERISKTVMKYGVAIYVDGFICGEWMLGCSEEARKFYQEQRRAIWSGKQRADLIRLSKMRGLPKAERDRFARDAKATTSTWSPYWPSLAALARHLRKTCTDIELVAVGPTAVLAEQERQRALNPAAAAPAAAAL